jgi:hypothetical protein
MTRIALLALSALALSACSDAPTAERVLIQNGYTKVVTTGYSVFGCSDKDTFSTGFRAVSPNGTRVEGVVCSGWLKGATIRFN